MFNDFKFLSFNSSKQKLGKLKDIFDRLKLPSLDERCFNLKNKTAFIDTQFVSLKEHCDATWPTTPPGPIEPPIPPEPPSPIDLPDLSVSIISAFMWDDSINFTVTVTNIGVAASLATILNNVIPPLPGTSVSVPALAIGESYTTVIPYVFNPVGTSETKTFLSEVNPARTFSETTYTNNSDSLLFNSKTPYPPGTLLSDLIIESVSLINYENVTIPLGGDGTRYNGIYYNYPYGQPRTITVVNVLVTVKNIGNVISPAMPRCKILITGSYPVLLPSGPGDPIPNIVWPIIPLNLGYGEIPQLNPDESAIVGPPCNSIGTYDLWNTMIGFIWMPVSPPHGEGWYPRRISISIEANPLFQYNYGHPLYPGYYRTMHESSYVNNSWIPINFEIEGAFYAWNWPTYNNWY